MRYVFVPWNMNILADIDDYVRIPDTPIGVIEDASDFGVQGGLDMTWH